MELRFYLFFDLMIWFRTTSYNNWRSISEELSQPSVRFGNVGQPYPQPLAETSEVAKEAFIINKS